MQSIYSWINLDCEIQRLNIYLFICLAFYAHFTSTTAAIIMVGGKWVLGIARGNPQLFACFGQTFTRAEGTIANWT